MNTQVECNAQTHHYTVAHHHTHTHKHTHAWESSLATAAASLRIILFFA